MQTIFSLPCSGHNCREGGTHDTSCLSAADATRFREIARVSSKMRWHKSEETEEEEEEEIGGKEEGRKEGSKDGDCLSRDTAAVSAAVAPSFLSC